MQLSKPAGSSEQGAKLDTAAQEAWPDDLARAGFEGEPAVLNGVVVPSASAWAFGGARVGETSDLFDDDNGYFMARLDSIREGGERKFENVKEDVRARVAVQHQLDKLDSRGADASPRRPRRARLEAAAQQANKKVEKTAMFARSSIVPGMGQYTEAVGAAFGLPTGQSARR